MAWPRMALRAQQGLGPLLAGGGSRGAGLAAAGQLRGPGACLRVRSFVAGSLAATAFAGGASQAAMAPVAKGLTQRVVVRGLLAGGVVAGSICCWAPPPFSSASSALAETSPSAAALLGSGGLGRRLLSWHGLGRGPRPAKCEEEAAPAPEKSVGAGKQPGASPGKVASLLAWCLVGSVWLVSIALPFVGAWALWSSQWRLLQAIVALYVLPLLVPLPALPASAQQGLIGALLAWSPSVAVWEGGSLMEEMEWRQDEKVAKQAPGARKQLFCLHPHGILTCGAFVLHDAKPEVRICTAPFLYWAAPLFRIMAALGGMPLGSVGRSGLAKHMGAGENPLALVPGGFQEATISCPGHERVYLKHRKGFVKYALRHGYDLVPCYTVGEADLFANLQGSWRLRFALNDFSLPAVVPWGFFGCPVLPRRRVPLRLAIGEPVQLPQLRDPSEKDVKEYHDRYMAALQELYARAVRGTASEGRPLEVW